MTTRERAMVADAQRTRAEAERRCNRWSSACGSRDVGIATMVLTQLALLILVVQREWW